VLFRPGDRVEAMHPQGGGDWFPGIVTAVRLPTPASSGDTTLAGGGGGDSGAVASAAASVGAAAAASELEVRYSIDYDDGDRELGVAASKVRAFADSSDEHDAGGGGHIDKAGGKAAAVVRLPGLAKGARVEVLPRGHGGETQGLWRAATVAAVHGDGSIDVRFVSQLDAPANHHHSGASGQREIRCDPARVRRAPTLAKGCSAACAVS
jgi:hypothetical protein